jgi:hypothetical protein
MMLLPYSEALPNAFEQESRADEQHRDCDSSRKNRDDCEQRANGPDEKVHASAPTNTRAKVNMIHSYRGQLTDGAPPLNSG